MRYANGMNHLKAIFIGLFITALVVLTGNALLGLVTAGERFIFWLGLLLAAGAPLSFFIWLFIAKPARTPRQPLAVTLLSALGMVIAMVAEWRFPGRGTTLFYLAAGSFIAWFVYLRWYSRFPRRRAKLSQGEPLPDFELQTPEGETVHSSAFTGQPHILLFYRGNWCPLCSAQVKELAGQYRQLAAAGAEVVLISPQPASQSRRLADRFDAPMRFLVDQRNRAARILGIDAPGGLPLGLQILGYSSDTVMPTVIITDAAGRVRWIHQTDNYRVRPEPETFLQVLGS